MSPLFYAVGTRDLLSPQVEGYFSCTIFSYTSFQLVTICYRFISFLHVRAIVIVRVRR